MGVPEGRGNSGSQWPSSKGNRPRPRATVHNHGLPPRNSLFIVKNSFALALEEATDPETYIRMKFRALTAVEEAVRRYPEDPGSWYVLGEWHPDHQPWPVAGPARSLAEPNLLAEFGGLRAVG